MSNIIKLSVALIGLFPPLAGILSHYFSGLAVFPFERSEVVLRFLPSLNASRLEISEVASNAIADKFLLAFGNIFAFSLLLVFLSAILFGFKVANETGKKNLSALNLQEKLRLALRGGALSLGIAALLLTIAIFFPIDFRPSNGISVERFVWAQYGRIVLLGPAFIMVFLAIVAVISVVSNLRRR